VQDSDRIVKDTDGLTRILKRAEEIAEKMKID